MVGIQGGNTVEKKSHFFPLPLFFSISLSLSLSLSLPSLPSVRPSPSSRAKFSEKKKVESRVISSPPPLPLSSSRTEVIKCRIRDRMDERNATIYRGCGRAVEEEGSSKGAKRRKTVDVGGDRWWKESGGDARETRFGRKKGRHGCGSLFEGGRKEYDTLSHVRTSPSHLRTRCRADFSALKIVTSPTCGSSAS